MYQININFNKIIKSLLKLLISAKSGQQRGTARLPGSAGCLGCLGCLAGLAAWAACLGCLYCCLAAYDLHHAYSVR